jgi:hypothetical protein
VFNLAAAVSVTLCIATLSLIWFTTNRWHFNADYWTYLNDADYGFRHNGTCAIRLVDGHLSAVRRYDDQMWLFAESAARAPRGWRWSIRPARAFPRMGAGSGLWFTIDARGWAIELPLWVPAALFAAWPTYRLLCSWLRGRTVPGGVCGNCGYDLRATPERCPECGAIAKPSTA